MISATRAGAHHDGRTPPRPAGSGFGFWSEPPAAGPDADVKPGRAPTDPPSGGRRDAPDAINSEEASDA